MNAPMRRGWCPGALKPMRTGDGLLVRVRLTGGVLHPDIASALAQAARDFGNGLFDLTARANLQMRGVADDALEPLLERLSMLGLLDADEAAEQVRNVMASPLAGLDPTAFIDASALARELEARLSGDPALHALPPKFGFLIDGGGVLPLDGVEADIGLRAVDAEAFKLTAGDSTLGFVAPEDAVETALDVAKAFLRHRRPDERRMRDLVKRLQDEAQQNPTPPNGGEVAQFSLAAEFALGLVERGREKCGPLALLHQDGMKLADHTPSVIASQCRLPHVVEKASVAPRSVAGYRVLTEASGFFAAAAPFGRLEAGQLQGLARLAQERGSALRLSPWRAVILAPIPIGEEASLGEAVATLGLVVDDADPRLAIAACPGSPSCLSGEAPAQADAARLAPVLAPFIREGASVHVAGCAKGCARRAPASIMLVGQGGRYGLAFDADSRMPSETPAMDIDEIAAFLKGRRPGNDAKRTFP